MGTSFEEPFGQRRAHVMVSHGDSPFDTPSTRDTEETQSESGSKKTGRQKSKQQVRREIERVDQTERETVDRNG